MRGLPQRMVGFSTPRFVSSVVFSIYCIHAISVHWDVYFSGQMFNEVATNYFFNAKTLGLGSLLQTDAGYWPFLLRLVSLFIEVLPIELAQVPYAYASVAFVGPVLLVLPFISSKFEVVVEGAWTRGLICSLLLLTMDWETRQFINWTNLAAFTLCYIVIRAIVTRDLEIKFLAGFLLLLATKPVVLPVGFLLALAYWRSGKMWSKLSSIVVLVWLGITGLAMYLAQFENSLPVKSNSLGEILTLSPLYFVKFFGAALIAPFQYQINFIVQIVLGLLLLIFAAAYFRARLNIWTFLVGIYVGLANFVVLVVGLPIPWNYDYLDENKIWFFRQFTPFWASFFLICIPIIAGVLRRSSQRRTWVRLGILFAVHLVVLLTFVFKPLTDINPVLRRADTAEVGLNEWSMNSGSRGLVDGAIEGDTCIAVNPFLTPFGRSCSTVSMTKLQSDETVTFQYMLPRESPKKLVGIYIISDGPRLESLSLEVDGRKIRADIRKVSIPGENTIWKIIPTQQITGNVLLRIPKSENLELITPSILFHSD